MLFAPMNNLPFPSNAPSNYEWQGSKALFDPLSKQLRHPEREEEELHKPMKKITLVRCKQWFEKTSSRKTGFHTFAS